MFINSLGRVEEDIAWKLTGNTWTFLSKARLIESYRINKCQTLLHSYNEKYSRKKEVYKTIILNVYKRPFSR